MSMQIDGPKGSPLMFIYSQRKIFENLSTSYLCKKYTKLKSEVVENFHTEIYKIKNQFFVLLLKEKKKIDNFLTTKSVYDTIFSSS